MNPLINLAERVEAAGPDEQRELLLEAFDLLNPRELGWESAIEYQNEEFRFVQSAQLALRPHWLGMDASDPAGGRRHVTNPTPNLSGFLRMIESLREGERLVFVSPRAGVISATLEKGFPTSHPPATKAQ